MANRTSTEPLLVRVDPDTRGHLKRVAESSDRSMSQLVRYATLWWTTVADRPRTIASASTTGNQSEFINIRFSADDMDLIRQVADEMNLERGAVVRAAVRAWLAAGDFTALGDPRLVAPTTPSAPGSDLRVAV